ncbi:hypothetical protein [Actinomadura bangladeshensis]|uniref:Uncharacterized protein n=1 Tax=Actinomadura bangladeshensis TaxID=453573 RepID=A0A4R4P3I9_9ACTN|nr:hypothetical protein [Actinomadura bangladeshensis]TDC16204.1 hypothetical protein E1284_13220 [Actinomadura bangladeshensis]
MRRPRLQYVAAGAIGVVGLIVAAVIAVAAVLASGNIPTAPSSYEIQIVRVADTGQRFAPSADVGLYPPHDVTGTAEKTGVPFA